MIPTSVVGAIVLGIPLLLIAWLALRRQGPVFLFAVVLILVGLGYLAMTGALDDIGGSALAAIGDLTSPSGGGSPAPVTGGAPAPAPSEYPTK